MDDPVLIRRAHIARLVELGSRVGYGLLLIAVVAFAIGFAIGFTHVITTIVTLSLLGTTATLAPAIVFGYAVRAAERDDRERGLDS